MSAIQKPSVELVEEYGKLAGTDGFLELRDESLEIMMTLDGQGLIRVVY